MDLSSLVDALLPTVRLAGSEIMRIYNKGFCEDYKNDGSPVTEADRIAEEIILASLKQVVPNIPVVSEENIASHSLIVGDEFLLVDPLDGTKEFIKRDGSGSFTVNIALIKKKNPVMGIVFAPALDRLFTGFDDQAFEITAIKKKKINVRSAKRINLVAVASSSHRDSQTSKWLIESKISNTISIGSSLKLCLLSTGEADVYPRFAPTMEWDTAAGHAVLNAAGGKVTTSRTAEKFFYGKPGFKNGSFIAWGDYKNLINKINT